jgi:hypothetical protein
MKKIIILDNANLIAIILPFDLSKFDEEEIQTFFDAANEEYDLDLKEQDCQWMISNENNPLNILSY